MDKRIDISHSPSLRIRSDDTAKNMEHVWRWIGYPPPTRRDARGIVSNVSDAASDVDKLAQEIREHVVPNMTRLLEISQIALGFVILLILVVILTRR